MIELNGVQFEPKSVEENIADIATVINNYATEHNVVNTEGEPMYIEQNMANPLYAILYGVGYLATQLQSLVYSAGAGFSIGEASDRQLVALAQLAGMHLRSATASLLPVTVTAGDSGCTIQGEYNQGSSIPNADYNTITIETSQGTAVFRSLYTVNLSQNEVKSLLLVSEENVSYTVTANTVTGFDQEISGLVSFSQESAISGNQAETVAQLRERLQSKAEVTTIVDNCADAISQLPGVTRASVIVNNQQSDDIEVGDITIPARQALVLVQGYSPDIAETFFSYLMCETVKTENTVPVTYRTKGGQALTVNILPPTLVPIYITIYVSAANTGEDTSLSNEFQENLKLAICKLSETTTIGQPVYTSDVLSIAKKAFPAYVFQGAEVNLAGFIPSYSAKPEFNQLIDFITTNITVEGVKI